jgi:hypothetical protein
VEGANCGFRQFSRFILDDVGILGFPKHDTPVFTCSSLKPTLQITCTVTDDFKFISQ